MQTVLYLQCNLFAIAVVIILFIANKKKISHMIDTNIFSILLISTAVVLLLESATWLLDGRQDEISSNILLSIVYFEDLMQIVPCYMWILYCDKMIFGKTSLRRKMIYAIPVGINIIFFIINIFTGIVCTVDQNGYYRRGDMFAFVVGLTLVYLVASFVISLYAYLKAKGTDRSQYLYMAIFPILPIIGIVLHALFFGLESVWIWVAISLLLVYINVQNHMSEKLERELTQNNIAIMLSQIQPHFLYNSLTTISYLCDLDPKQAKQATIKFAKYLRGNLDSIKSSGLIKFEQELKHIEVYLALEKIRYVDRLNIMYNIESTDFMLPSLSIEPLVENAVKYGIGHKEGGGTLTISTFEDDNFYIVTVADDGVGFDLSEAKDDGKTHIGISNVQSRISVQCGGKLEINSKKNVGTTITVKIPKDKNKI